MIRLIACGLSALVGMLPSTALARSWTLHDAARVAGIFWVEASARGDVLYGVVRTDLAHNEFSTEYFLLHDGRTRRVPFAGTILALHWAPDGRTLAVLTPGRDGGSSIDVVDADTGRLLHAFGSSRSIQRFSWSPDGRSMAAIEFAPAERAPAESVWLAPDGDILGRQPAKRSLWVIDAQTGATRHLADDGYSYGGPVTDHDPSWSADGRRLLVVRQPSATYADFERAEFVTVDVKTGSAKAPEGPRPQTLPNSIAPQFDRRGRVLTVHTWDGTFTAREDLFVDGNDISAAFDHDFWSCGNSAALWDGDGVLATTMDGVDTRLYRFAAGAAPVALTPSGGSVLAFSARGGRIIVAYSTPAAPPELFEITENRTMRQLTHLNGIPTDLAIAPTKLLHWVSKNGHDLVGQLSAQTRPAAVLTEPHGGPQCADDSSFSPYVQYFATNGYAYFRPSVSGSDGYGDWSYKAIVNDFGAGPLDDLLRGVEAASTATQAAPGLFLYGASYGGYLTAYAVTHDDRFKAAVAAVPVTDIGLDYELSESPNITRRFFGRTPLIDNRARMDEQSPIAAAQNLRTPLLLMIGLRDTRAPYPQALAFYRALTEFGKPVRLLAYPNDGHGPASPRATADWFAHIAGWFATYGGPQLPGALRPPGQ